MKFNSANMDQYFYTLVVALFILIISPCNSSFVFVDWTFDVPADLYISKFLIDYSPPIGDPRPNTAISSNRYQMNLNGTKPATEYRVALSAFDATHNQVLLIEKRLISTPSPPIVDRITADNSSGLIEIKSPSSTGISYYVEYSPDNQVEKTQFVQTKSNVIHLVGLQPAVLYVVRLLSVYRSVPSASATIVEFLTVNPTPSPSPTTTTIATPTTAKTLWWQTTLAMTLPPTTTTTTSTSTTTTTTTTAPTTTTTRRTTTTTVATTTTTVPTTTTTRATTTTVPTTTYASPIIIRTMPPRVTTTVGEPVTVPIEFYVQDSQVWLEWSAPSYTECKSYELRYAFDSDIANLQNHFVSVNRYAMPEFADDTVRAKVTCFTTSGEFSYRWQADGLFSIRVPAADIRSLRVVDVQTGKDGMATANIAVEWPDMLDTNVYSTRLSYMSHRTNEIFNMTVPAMADSVRITELTPSTKYTIGATNITSSGSMSRMKEIEMVTPPEIDSTLHATDVSGEGARVTFTASRRAVFDYYQLTVEPEDRPQLKIEQFIKKGDVQKDGIYFDTLRAGLTYTATLYTVNEGIRSRPVSTTFVTSSIGVDRVIVMLGDEWVDLHWIVNEMVRDDASRYEIKTASSDDDAPPAMVVLAGHIRRHRFDNLLPASSYTFDVTLIQGDTRGNKKSVSVVTNPSDTEMPLVARVSDQHMAVRFERSTFWHVNGRVTNYAVLVASSLTERKNIPPTYPVSTWQQAAKNTVWPVFQATPYTYNPFSGGDRQVVFFIGLRYCMNMDVTDYCNGPLEPNIEYGVKIRGCTDDLICMETAFTRAGRRTDWVPSKRENNLPEQSRGYGRDRLDTQATSRERGRGRNEYNYGNRIDDYEYEPRTTTELSKTLASGKGHEWLMSLFNSSRRTQLSGVFYITIIFVVFVNRIIL